jgi:uncharacterized protein with PIN domain
MVLCRIILHGDLAELTGGRSDVLRRLPHPTSARDAVEALGVPHVELGAVEVDDVPADLAARVSDGARLAVWPAAPHPLADPRFVCDLHLGKLARLLRFCGFDTLWNRRWREPALARLAQREGRTVLSRHRALLKRSAVTSGMLVRANDADAQLAEVLRRFRLADRITSPGRCAACNGELVPTAKADVPVPIPPRTAAWRDDYWLCRDCGQLFWEGTHVERLRRRVERAVAAS